MEKNLNKILKNAKLSPGEKILISYKGKDHAQLRAKYTTQLEIMVRELNPKGWVPKEDGEESIYFPYFKKDKNGFGFYSVDYYGFWFLGVGSRQGFQNYKTAEFAGKTFLPLYKKIKTYYGK